MTSRRLAGAAAFVALYAVFFVLFPVLFPMFLLKRRMDTRRARKEAERCGQE